MLFSPAAVRGFAEGGDYLHALEPAGRLYDELVASHRIALLGTGSPQVYYELSVAHGPASPEEVGAARHSVQFGLRVEGGALHIRDGYALMEWLGDDPDEVVVPLTDGYYAVRALASVLRDEARDDVSLRFFLEPSQTLIPGDGWPYLEIAF